MTEHKAPEMYSKAISQFDSKEDFLDSIVHSIVSPLPKNLLEKCRGISSLGRKFQDLKWLINETTYLKFDEFIYGNAKLQNEN